MREPNLLILADLRRVLPHDGRSVVFVLDVSESISPTARTQTQDWIQEQRAAIRVGRALGVDRTPDVPPRSGQAAGGARRRHHPGRTEVEHLDPPVRRDHHVSRRDIAVGDPGCVRSAQTFTNLGRNVDGVVQI